MSYELVKENIILDKKIEKEFTQLLLESDLVVPDIKPDVALILQSIGVVNIEKIDVSVDKVNFNGQLSVKIMYLSKGAQKPVTNMTTNIPIDDYINLDGVNNDMWVDLSSELTHLEVRLLNERKISIKAVVGVSADATSSSEISVVTKINDIPEPQQKISSLKISRTASNKKDLFIVKDELTVPSGQPNISEILQSKIIIANKDVKVLSGKVTIKGDLLIPTLYVGDTDDSIVEFIEHEVPFNGSIEIKEATEEMYADIALSIQDKYIQVRPDADGEERIIDMEVGIYVCAKLSYEQDIQVLEDAYCINKNIIIQKEKIKYPKTICRNKNQSTIKETVTLDKSCPNIMQVYHVIGETMIDDFKVFDDRVVVDGLIKSYIIYVAESDSTPLFSHYATIPFSQAIETKGSKSGMHIDIETELIHTAFNMLSEREVEVRFVTNINTHVCEEKEFEMITDLTLEDLDKSIIDNIASMTIYVVQPKDTLWKIAKRYNTSIEELIALNDIENPNKIYPGQKLLIVKKVID